MKRERPIRDMSNPWVCSVLFEGDSKPQFLVGNAGLASEVPLLFTDDPTKAQSARRRSWFTFGWPFLIMMHAQAIGRKPRAIVHRLKDKPNF